jgi:cytochrome oxidase Cu insertion factor (SCO1/SenC/PrrC family)
VLSRTKHEATELVPAIWRASGRRRWRARSGLSLALVGALLASSGQLLPASVLADLVQPADRTGEVRGVAGQQVGEPAPEFTVVAPDGQPVSSVDLLAQEKPFILFFFATW